MADFAYFRFGQKGCRSGGYYSVTAFALSLVQGFIRELEQEIDTVGSFVECGYADGDSQTGDRWLVGLLVPLQSLSNERVESMFVKSEQFIVVSSYAPILSFAL